MSIENKQQLNKFHNILKMQERPFLLHNNLPAKKANLQFEGIFNGQPVVWNACVSTIEEYSRHNQVAKDPMQYIKIEVLNNKYILEIGLNVKQIDLPVIERTIIMIRKYKQLGLGLHEYGARSKTE